MQRSHLVSEVTGLKSRVTELSSEVAATVEERDGVRQQLAARVSRVAQIRQILAGWSKD